LLNAGRWAASRCLQVIAREVPVSPMRLTALLGFDANLLAVIGPGWPQVSSAPFHMILHI